MTARISTTLLAAFALGSQALAQNDECTGALALNIGATPYDTTSATLSAQPWICGPSAAPDLWYSFTAPSEAIYSFDTCGSGYDTVIALYDGTCANLNLLQCNDDSAYCTGGVLSYTAWRMLAGETVYLRVGGFSTAAGVGIINVTQNPYVAPMGSTAAWLSAVASGSPAIYTNSDLRGPIVDDIGSPIGASKVTYEFIVHGDNMGASNALMGNLGSGIGSSAALKFEQWPDTFAYGVTAYGIADYTFPGGNNTEHQDIQLVYVADILAGTTELFVDGVSFGTANFAPLFQGEQGIGQASRPGTSEPIDIMWLSSIRGVAVYDTGLSLAEIQAHKDAYFSGSLGTPYCVPAVANSTGNPAVMGASGSLSVATNNLTLECSDMPNNAFGFFLTSRTQGMIANPGGSQGVLCLSGSIGRYVGPGQIKNSGGTGAISLMVNLNQHPTPTGLVQVLPGETWNFTAWFRDSVGGVATSNFSNGRQLTFQ